MSERWPTRNNVNSSVWPTKISQILLLFLFPLLSRARFLRKNNRTAFYLDSAAATAAVTSQCIRQDRSPCDLSAARAHIRVKISKRLQLSPLLTKAASRISRGDKERRLRRGKTIAGAATRHKGCVARVGGGGRRSEGEGDACSTRRGATERCRESYINYSDVICMLMGYICMSTRK